MAIVKQVDADYEGDGVVAFIQSAPRYRAGGHGEMVTGETYNVEIHQKPLDSSGLALKFCKHEHREIDAAVRCARRLLRSVCRGSEASRPEVDQVQGTGNGQ